MCKTATAATYLLLVLFILLFSGCLISETTEYTLILNDDGKSGKVTVIMRNVQSDEADPTKQEKDFKELIKNWKSDRYLVEQLDKGLYVKERKLYLERGKLIWKETSLFADVQKLIPEHSASDSMKISLGDTAGLLITTNGKIIADDDSSVIIWQPGEKVFEFKARVRNFQSASKFAERFRRHLKGQK
ncbi:MAG: hypothetical protein HY707_08315 [Ignavibacteriae bacterium]|nr:hypothetical protein [Ignavibacteriota bacterium]